VDVVLLSDPRIAAIPVRDNGEPLVDLREGTPLQLDPRRADAAGAYAHLRSGLVDLLVAAQSLLPRGIHLLVIEGYRPLPLQQRYYDRYATGLRQAHPQWTPDEVRSQASRYIAPPEVAPHVTGGAVDITLAAADGTELFMGTEVNATPDATASIGALARRNRELLASTLMAVGLRNYPTAWWHWSYGDRYWAFVVDGIARYGPTSAPTRPS
jgi:D-alanyl-D-alanine dipeptidase